MSTCGLTNPCPECGDNIGPFFMDKHDAGGPCFVKGYSCGVCGHYWLARDSDKRDHPDDFKPYPAEVETKMIEPHDPESEDITLDLEMRPSTITGISWWAMLKYKHHVFDELLPLQWGELSEEARDVKMAEVANRLQSQLRPILLAEDRKSRLTLLPNEQAHVPLTEHEI